MGNESTVEIKIINCRGELFGVQKTVYDIFHDYYKRYPYFGIYQENDIIRARLIYQAHYPGDQWQEMSNMIAENTDRRTRRVYVDI